MRRARRLRTLRPLAWEKGNLRSRNHNEDRRFAVQPVAGDALPLEYNLPPDATAVGEIRLSGVVHDFIGVATSPPGSALLPPCQIDVNCPQGDSHPRDFTLPDEHDTTWDE